MSPKRKTSILKNLSIIGILTLGTFLLPTTPIAPWLGISFSKIFSIILAVSLVQIIGVFLVQKINSNLSIVLYGFIAGFISSTALTLSLARKSSKMNNQKVSVESLSFLTASSAMLIQGLLLAKITNPQLHFNNLIIFLIPLLITLGLIIYRVIHTQNLPIPKDDMKIRWSTTLKLSIFICAIVSVSHFTAQYLGEIGLEIVNFIISLFEVHGSIISNSQMFANQKINESTFNLLIMSSLLASYLSKIIIIYISGSTYLKKKVSIWSFFIIGGLILSWRFLS